MEDVARKQQIYVIKANGRDTGKSSLTAKPFIVPLTCAVLMALFLLQTRGTAGIGKIFGPAMIICFLSIWTSLSELHQTTRKWTTLKRSFAKMMRWSRCR